MTLKDFKGHNSKYRIIVESYKDGEVYEAIPEKAIADIASAYNISNDEALRMLEDSHKVDSFVECETKNCQFHVETIIR